MRDIVAIFKEIKTTLSNYFEIVEDMPLNVWNKKHLKRCLSKGMTLEEILPVCTMLSLKIHLISRTREFTCLHSYPTQVDWSLTPIFILIEETIQQTTIAKNVGKKMVTDKTLPNGGIEVYTENQIQYYAKTEGSKGMERKRSNKNKAIMHFTKISRKASEREVELTKRKLNELETTFHCSAILNPTVFANQFKDISYCATCCVFYTGLKIDHNCWVPLSTDCSALLEQCYTQFQTLKDDIQSLAWNIKGLKIAEQKNFPAKQMMQFATYQDLMAILQCASCKRWKWTSRNVPNVSMHLKLLKRKILHVENMPLTLTQYQDWPKNVGEISLHHLTHTFCIESKPHEQCDQCGQECPGNVTCVKTHKKYNCAATNRSMRQYEECDVCLMKYPLHADIADYSKRHRHFDEICHNCKNIIPANDIYTHACPLRVFSAPVPYRKIACYDFETAAMQNDKTGDKIHEPVFLSCYFETSKICHFSKKNLPAQI